MRRNTTQAKLAHERNRKDPPAPPSQPTKKVVVPISQLEAARADVRQLDLWSFFGPAASTGGR
jgi:hypothetical protein